MAWRTLHFGKGSRCGFTLLHIRVDGEAVQERDNLCPTPDDVYKLFGLDWLVATFATDPIVNTVLEITTSRGQAQVADVPLSVGLPGELDLLQSQLAQRALRATRHVLEQTERFVKELGKQLLVILSYSYDGVLRALQGEPIWDQALVDFLKTRDYPFVNLRDAHRAEFAGFNGVPDEYLNRYYIGYYAPAGNFFFAQALKDTFIDWLNPKPLPYQ